MSRPCGDDSCAVSTGIGDELTFGRGFLDRDGYWDIPCRTCAEAFEKEHPGEFVWPGWNGKGQCERPDRKIRRI